jgi:cysteine-rich repeat protein
MIANMTRWLVVFALVVGGCVSSNSVTCENGTTCPEVMACDLAHGGCVRPDQLTSCAGMPDNMACLTNGACHDEVCFPIACGNHFVDPDEACDDGNLADGDECAHDCLSDLTCGNSTQDMSTGETCDDGNHVNHDGCTSTCQVEDAHWLQYVAKPGPHARVAAAYDSRRDRVVMFSGATDLNNALTNKTWEWTGTLWLDRATPSTPPPRYESAMAFDHARGRTVLFGGNAASLIPVEMADTWEWDGVAWYQIPVEGPPARTYHALVYDAARKRIVLFGGISLNEPRNDTWEYDGKVWTQIQTPVSPPARYEMLASYDPKRGRVVIASGLTGSLDAPYYADTWEYDGTTWRDVTPAAGLKPQLSLGGMAFDSTLQKLVVFGGYTPSNTASNKTYTWDGTTWTDLSIVVAQPDGRYAMAFVSSFPHPLLAGGATPSVAYHDDTYQFTGSTWTAPSSIPAIGYEAVTDPLRRAYVLYGNGNTYELTASGYAPMQSGVPSVRTSPAFVADPLHDNVLMFGGGIAGGNSSSETWTYATGTWSQRTTTTTPPARQGARAAFDGARVIMFGGRAASTGAFFDDTWSWDGTNWSAIPTSAAPPARMGVAMGYDPIRKEVILFGGFTYTGDYVYWNDTWAFDGTTWTQRSAAVSPSGRAGASLTWNPARGCLVLVGGGAALDAWEWTGTEWRAVGVPEIPAASLGGVAPTFDGSGITGFGVQSGQHVRLELRWDGPGADESCDGNDLDLDMKTGCDDDDCLSICKPLCPPNTSCMDTPPSCGDTVCSSPRETCHTCPADCDCTPVCGDFYCDPGETCPGDCPI